MIPREAYPHSHSHLQVLQRSKQHPLQNSVILQQTTIMQFTTSTLALLTTLISSSSAIITGVTAPSTVYAYNPFTVTLTTANYIQSVYDVAVSFGVTPAPGYEGAIGNVITSAFLGPSKSNVLTPLTFDMTLPAGTQNGPYVLSAAVFSLYGVSSGPVATIWNTTIVVAGY